MDVASPTKLTSTLTENISGTLASTMGDFAMRDSLSSMHSVSGRSLRAGSATSMLSCEPTSIVTPEVEDLKNDVHRIVEVLAEVETRVREGEVDVDALQKDADAAQRDRLALETAVGYLNDKVNGLERAVGALSARLASEATAARLKQGAVDDPGYGVAYTFVDAEEDDMASALVRWTRDVATRMSFS